MQYLNLTYTPGIASVYRFVMTTDFGADIDVTLSTWSFEAFDMTGTSVYKNSVPTSLNGNKVTFTVPIQNPEIFVEGNYYYRVFGTLTSTGVTTAAYKGFVTVQDPTVVS